MDFVLIGLISDTHGYVDPRLAAAFAGVEAIVHAGDVGGVEVLDALRAMAPLYAVRGNNDEKLGGLGLPLRAGLRARRRPVSSRASVAARRAAGNDGCRCLRS